MNLDREKPAALSGRNGNGTQLRGSGTRDKIGQAGWLPSNWNNSANMDKHTINFKWSASISKKN